MENCANARQTLRSPKRNLHNPWQILPGVVNWTEAGDARCYCYPPKEPLMLVSRLLSSNSRMLTPSSNCSSRP